MLEKEVEYRLCRWLLANLVGDGLLTEAAGVETNRLLLEKLDPPFRSAENVDNKIGDGVRIHE